MMHFRELSGAVPVSDDADEIAQKIKDMNRTLQYCSDDVRYDLQRNLVRELEILCRRSPLSLAYRKVFRDIAGSVADSYTGRGQVHLALSRVAKQKCHETKDNNVWSFDRLTSVFKRNSEADSFLVDRMLARRSDDGELSLTVWGEYVLEFMEKEMAARNRENIYSDISPSN